MECTALEYRHSKILRQARPDVESPHGDEGASAGEPEQVASEGAPR